MLVRTASIGGPMPALVWTTVPFVSVCVSVEDVEEGIVSTGCVRGLELRERLNDSDVKR